jgi:hypothetical protein
MTGPLHKPWTNLMDKCFLKLFGHSGFNEQQKFEKPWHYIEQYEDKSND